MEITIITKEEQITSEWSGGTTTELYIYPEGSRYKERDFLFRLSTAVCRDEKSEFTFLPGIRRQLMVLEGAVKLKHTDTIVELTPGQQEAFDGGERTSSEGVCKDFNLMLREKSKGTIQYKIMRGGETTSLEIDGRFTAVYVFQGKINLYINKGIYLAKEQDFAMLHTNGVMESCILKAVEGCQMVIVSVSEKIGE